MRQTQPVLWTKGVLLSPQHLQTQDRFLEDLLGFHVSNLAFKPWGYKTLEIDREALADNSFAISSASGVLPDGLLFDIPGADNAPSPKPLEQLWRADQTALDVYITVPKQRGDGQNVAIGEADGQTRFIAEVLLRRDETTGLSEKPIQVARKNFKLLSENESREGSTSMQIARILKGETGDYSLDPAFIPPLIDIAANEQVMAITRRLVERLVTRGTELSANRRHKDQRLADFRVSEVEDFWLLYTINTYLPIVRHVFEVRRGHPCDLYTVMLSLAGALSTFSTKVDPKDFPQYQHDNLSWCFKTLDDLVLELLGHVIPDRYKRVPLQLIEPLIYAASIDDDRLLTAPHWYLAVKSDASPIELSEKVPKLVKVGSGDRVSELISQALSGVELTHLRTAPPVVRVQTGHLYFELSKQGVEWDNIVKAGNLAAYVPADIPDPELELLVVVPNQDQSGSST